VSAGDVFLEHLELGHVVDEHPRLGFERQLDATAFGVLGQLQATGHEPIPRLMLRHLGIGSARAKTDALGMQLSRNVHGAPQEFQPNRAPLTADE